VRIFNHAEYVVPKGSKTVADAYSFANILNVCALSCASDRRCFKAASTSETPPVNNDTSRTCGRGGIGVETELVAADFEADLKRLVKVGLDAENV
jgi:hypothetical protein